LKKELADILPRDSISDYANRWRLGCVMNTALVMPRRDDPPRDALLASKNPNPLEHERRRRVLIIDDEHLIADTLAEILNDSGNFLALAAYDGASALEQARKVGVDVLITDVVMPEMNGIQGDQSPKGLSGTR
jgi:hypothetical protein